MTSQEYTEEAAMMRAAIAANRTPTIPVIYCDVPNDDPACEFPGE